MKPFIFAAIAFAFLLIACSPATGLSPTATFAPTSTLTVTPPAPDLPATATVNPDVKPQGADHFDASRGLWVNAKGEYYLPNPDGTQAWMKSITSDPIPLVIGSQIPDEVLNGAKVDKTFTMLPITVYVNGTATALSSVKNITRSNDATEYDIPGGQEFMSNSLPSQILTAFEMGESNLGYQSMNNGSMIMALQEFAKGSVQRTIEVPQPDGTIETYNVDWATAKPIFIVQPWTAVQAHPEAWQNAGSTSYRYQVNVVNGNPVFTVAMKSKDNIATFAPLFIAMERGGKIPPFPVYSVGNISEVDNFGDTPQAKAANVLPIQIINFFNDTQSLLSGFNPTVGGAPGYLAFK